MQAATLTWVGGEHEFALPLGALRGLQDATNKGPEELLNAFRLGSWRVDDAIQVLRFGLIGAGMEKAEASRLVTAMVDLHPKVQFKLTSLTVLMHALFGSEDDPVGEAEGVTTPAPENGASQNSTETAL